MGFDLESQYLKYKNINTVCISDSSSDDEKNGDTEDLEASTPAFIIDKNPASIDDPDPKPSIVANDEPSLKPKKKKKNLKDRLSSELKVDSKEKSYITVEPEKCPELIKQNFRELSIGKEDELMKKSVFQPGFEKLYSIPPYEETKGQLKKKWKQEKDKTKGANWFNLPATEMTEERKNDLTILQMRKALDTKRFYKKNDRSSLPKYFQVGTIIESPADFYHARIPKKQRKQTIVEELLADADFQTKSKKKYKEAMKSKPRPFRERRDKMKRKRKTEKNQRE